MITSVFGIPVKYETWNGQRALPIYISANYEFYGAIIDDQRCIVITPLDDLPTIPSLKKQIKRIQEVDNVPVVLELSSVSSYRKKSLIENKIPFVTKKQIYLPFIGTLLTSENETERQTVQTFMFSTQQLVLFYLYNNKPKLYVAEATEKLPFTAMTLSRAVKQLEAVGLFMITKDGVNKVIESKYNRWELFNKVEKYLSTPVRKVGYIEKSNLTEDMVIAGESALAEKTMLNPSRLVTYAVYEKLFDKKLLVNELVDTDKQIRLELWAYNPKQFADGNMADTLSVALSFGGNTDERIEETVEELLEKELRG